MQLDLDSRSPVPLYLQIAEQVRRLVALGALRPGDRLPTIREMAAQSRVNRNTAARAIQLLETEGVVRTRVGSGTFVVEDGHPRIDAARRDAAIERALDHLVVEAYTLGVPLEELGWRLSRRIEAFRRRRESAKGEGRGGEENANE